MFLKLFVLNMLFFFKYVIYIERMCREGILEYFDCFIIGLVFEIFNKFFEICIKLEKLIDFGK